MKLRTARWTTRKDAKQDSRYIHPQIKRQLDRSLVGLNEIESLTFLKPKNV